MDTILGPEMRSTGEVMGIADSFPAAFLKALIAAGSKVPDSGLVFVSVRDADKPAACDLAHRLVDQGFQIVATRGTARALERNGVKSEVVNKASQGRPHIVDRLRNGDIDMVINTTEGARAIRDSRSLRRQTLMAGIPYFTTIAASTAAVAAIEARRESDALTTVKSLQEYNG